jgi:hypothetical protein
VFFYEDIFILFLLFIILAFIAVPSDLLDFAS